jgi:hypothetical protein
MAAEASGPAVAIPAGQVDYLLATAARAPSVHNTQPWRFSVDGAVIDVWADEQRRLDYLDPTGRQLHVSSGAAIEFAYLTARSLGRACAVALQPDPRTPDLLARLTLGAPVPPTNEERLLAGAIARRYTDRGPYTDRELPPRLLIDVQRRAAELGVWVRLLDRPGERSGISALLADAEAAEAGDAGYATEIARWTTTDARPEGLPATAVPEWPAERVSDVPLRDFTGHDAHRRPGDRPTEAPPVVERDTLLLLGTADDDAASWLNAGRAVGWLLLRCASDGASAQPLGPAIDLPPARSRLRQELGLVGHPQFLLRMGYGTGRPRTRRRSANALLSPS